jgi:hypothetical protein
MTERHDLDLLRWHWGAFYEITIAGPVWRAKRLDDGTVLAAGSSAQLRLLLSRDYDARPVPRRGRPPH